MNGRRSSAASLAAPAALLGDIRALIEAARKRAASTVNSELTMLYWRIGQRIRTQVLDGRRGAYGKEVLPTLAAQLVKEYGGSFAEQNLRRMVQFAATLDDIDWRTARLNVQAKGGARVQMPLPDDVGQAIAAYLQGVPRRTACRRLFVRERAPHVGMRVSESISEIVRTAIERAGVQTPFKGAHVLRHTLATQMLRGGASLDEIGQLLRHRSPDTTRIYAKVDLDALHTLALPWPGGVQ